MNADRTKARYFVFSLLRSRRFFESLTNFVSADFRIALLREKERWILCRDMPIFSGKSFGERDYERLIIKLIGV